MATLDLEAFVSGLIHAVNNPLTYVQTNLTSLRRDLGDVMRLLEACEAVVERAGRELEGEVAMIRRMRAELAMDRPGEVLGQIIGDAQEGLAQVQVYLRAARAAPKLLAGGPAEAIAAGPWLTEVMAVHRKSLPVGLALELEGEPSGVFTGTRSAWDHVIGALVLNARDAIQSVRARRNTGRIRVTWESYRVIVDDDGPGVPAGIRDRIFLPFFTTRPGAVGLGLALAASLAESGGGGVGVEAGPGPLGGARFWVRLPPG